MLITVIFRVLQALLQVTRQVVRAKKYQCLGWAKTKHLFACYLPSFVTTLLFYRGESSWWKSRFWAKWIQKANLAFHGRLDVPPIELQWHNHIEFYEADVRR